MVEKIDMSRVQRKYLSARLPHNVSLIPRSVSERFSVNHLAGQFLLAVNWWGKLQF